MCSDSNQKDILKTIWFKKAAVAAEAAMAGQYLKTAAHDVPSKKAL